MIERMIRLREARRARRKGRFREALEVLSTPPLSGHRDALGLRDSIFMDLMKKAHDCLDRGDLANAREALTVARAAGYEGEEGVRLMSRLTQEERDQGVLYTSKKKMLSEIRHQVDAGSLIGAREKLDSLQESGQEVDEIRKWVEARAKDLDRYLNRCRSALKKGDLETAHAAIERAESLFPTNPEIRKLKCDVQDFEERKARGALAHAIKTESPQLAWTQYLETIHKFPTLKNLSEFQRFQARFQRQMQKAAQEAMEGGDPDKAGDILSPLLVEADREILRLDSGVRQWKRARELFAAGELHQAIALLSASRERVGTLKSLQKEIDAAENAISRRDEILEQIESALESHDFKLAADRMDKAISAGESPSWLVSLRREVRSRLDAGEAALIEVAKLVREGRTADARLGLIPLLSRKGIRDQALAHWKDIDDRESKAAALFGRAEAITMDPCAGKGELLEALKAVDGACSRRTDQPRLKELRDLVLCKIEGWGRFEEASTLSGNGQLDSALICCRSGLEADPAHKGLRDLHETLALRRGKELLREAESLLATGNHEKARSLLTRAGDLTFNDAEVCTRIRRLLTVCEPHCTRHSRAVTLDPPPGLPQSSTGPLERFVLRIEEGPEALVWTTDTLHIGNARNSSNQIALMANISSRHAILRREMSFHGGMLYSIQAESGKDCHVNGNRIREMRLSHGDEIQLGQDVLLRFMLPDPGSASALLEILKGYHVDDIRKILLLKGPGRDGRIRIGNTPRAHLQAPKADQVVDLYLECPPDGSPAALMAESESGIEVDGIRHDHTTQLTMGAYLCCGSCRFQIGRP